MEASKSLSCENNTSTLFSAVPDSSNMYLNKDSNLISESMLSLCCVRHCWQHFTAGISCPIYIATLLAVSYNLSHDLIFIYMITYIGST